MRDKMRNCWLVAALTQSLHETVRWSRSGAVETYMELSAQLSIATHFDADGLVQGEADEIQWLLDGRARHGC